LTKISIPPVCRSARALRARLQTERYFSGVHAAGKRICILLSPAAAKHYEAFGLLQTCFYGGFSLWLK
jgi:hypothetical protein